MLRISHYLRALAGQCAAPRVASPGSSRPPVVIWNLLRRCNLTCKHCYATSADSVFRDELDTTAALQVIDDLHDAGVRVLILSGGEPLLREDLFQLSAYARDKGFFLALSTNPARHRARPARKSASLLRGSSAAGRRACGCACPGRCS